jgi:hypothetical protein
MVIKPLINSVFIMGLLSIFGINIAGASSTGQYFVPPSDFTIVNSYYNCTYFNYGNSLQPALNDNSCYFVSGIRLPDGVTVTKITMYWYDFDEIENIEATIYRSTFFGEEEGLSTISSTFLGAAGSSDVGTSFLIDNGNYEYYIRVNIPTVDLMLFGFRIEYTNQSFLSLVVR